MKREASIKRATSETEVSVSVVIDGSGAAKTDCSNQFLDHMIESLARHSMMDITVKAISQDGILHHVIEDTAITLGIAIGKALGERNGIFRFASSTVPMDESLAECSVDLVRRPYFDADLGLEGPATEGVPREDLEHFFDSLLGNMEACVHIRMIRGGNDHHRVEAAIKALAVSLRRAASADPRRPGPASTKGTM